MRSLFSTTDYQIKMMTELREVNVDPACEAVGQVPFGLAMTHEDKSSKWRGVITTGS